MKTIVMKLDISTEDSTRIRDMQVLHNRDFRRIYHNLDLMKDPEFIASLNTKPVKALEYLMVDVVSFHKRHEAGKVRILKKIKELEEEPMTPKIFKRITRLKRSVESKVVFGGRKNLQDRTKGLITHEEFVEFRLYPMSFHGETSRQGNRFFDLSDLSNGNILFKYDRKTHIPLKIRTRKHKEELCKIQDMVELLKLPVTIKLTHNEIHISFDESILAGTNFDHKKHQMEKPAGLDKDETKAYWAEKHREHDAELKKGKLERFVSIDVNPNEIGFCVADSDMNILDKGCYKIVGDISEDKRKYEYSQIVKDLFRKVRFYRASYFVIEELDFEDKDTYGNKVSNRLLKLEFKKDYIFSLIRRRCNETGTILREPPAYYSSFIGNLTFKEYDPIASAMEMCRRGIGMYTKGFKMIPDLVIDNIFTDGLDGSVDLSRHETFIGLFKSIRNKSYRRKVITFSRRKFTRGDESHVLLCF